VTRQPFLDVLHALLWGFHNSRSGVCFPSYERIAEKAGVARSTVAEGSRRWSSRAC
jgi:Helix-turn-helix domain